MAVKKTPLSYEFDGDLLVVSQGDDVVRRYNFADVPEELDRRFWEFGRKTKLSNFGASAKQKGLNRLDMMDAGWELMLDGEWEFEREGGGPTVSVAVEALAKIKKASVADIQKSLRKYDAATRKSILAKVDKTPEAEAIRKAREAAKTVEVSLEDFEG